jgi:uncharacterized membrane protein
MKKLLIACLLILAFATGGFAQEFSDKHIVLPESILVSGEKIIKFYIENPYEQELPLSLELFAPPDANIKFVEKIPEKIEGKEKAYVTMTIYAPEKYDKSTYMSTMVATLGGERAVKHIEITFKYMPQKDVNVEVDENRESIFTGLVSFATLENVINAILAVIAVVLFVILVIRIAKR